MCSRQARSRSSRPRRVHSDGFCAAWCDATCPTPCRRRRLPPLRRHLRVRRAVAGWSLRTNERTSAAADEGSGKPHEEAAIAGEGSGEVEEGAEVALGVEGRVGDAADEGIEGCFGDLLEGGIAGPEGEPAGADVAAAPGAAGGAEGGVGAIDGIGEA